MADMLVNAVNAGTGTEARIAGMTTGGKTGTTTDNKDRWFVGFTPYYVAAVWTGYDTPEYMNFSGNPAAQIFRLVMTPIHEGMENKSFPKPTIGAPTGIFGDMKEEEPEETTPVEPPAATPSPEGGGVAGAVNDLLQGILG